MSGNWVGKTLGKVHIEAFLARGGVAEVYLGTHVTLQRRVAVKFLRNPSEEDSEALERFQHEARAVAKLRHPNIVQVYDFDLVNNDPYLVMEYIPGPSLSNYLYFLHQINTQLELPQVVRVIRGIASALQYAHNNGVVHRDVKPGNILLTSPKKEVQIGELLPDDFEPVLTDFGLVRFLDTARQTNNRITAGTPAYMSPEQARGEFTDGRTDVYSLGIVLYEMLAGKLPFDGETTMSILLKHIAEPPEAIPGLSPLMQQVLDKALEKKVKSRYQTPAEFSNAFGAALDITPETMQIDSIVPFLGRSTTEIHNAPTQLPSNFQVKERKPRRFWVGAIGIFILMAGIVWLFNGLPFPQTTEPTSSIPPITNTLSSISTTAGTLTSIPTLPPQPVILGTSATLSFQDGNAIADQAVLDVQRMPATPDGNQYEVWLVGSRTRISLGVLSLDESGMGNILYTDANGANLASLYNRAEITIEPLNDPSPSPSGLVVYSFSMPAEGLTNVRYLLSAFTNTPDKTALIQGLFADFKKLNELALVMQLYHDAGDETRVRRNAEAILNLIAGSQSPGYRDWDEDGIITDESDGYGLLLNGSSPGYIQAVYTEADNTVGSAGASEPMVAYGGYLKIAVQNLAQWTQELEEKTHEALISPSSGNISEIVALTNKMLRGTDLNNNGVVDPVPGESGAEYAYRYAYSMANMPLVNIGLTPTLTVGSDATGGGGEGGGGGGSEGGGGPTPEPTKRTGKPPTNTPRPKNDNNSNKN